MSWTVLLNGNWENEWGMEGYESIIFMVYMLFLQMYILMHTYIYKYICWFYDTPSDLPLMVAFVKLIAVISSGFWGYL